MITGRPKQPVVLSEVELLQLKSIARSHSMPYNLVIRARTILMAAQGVDNKTVAQKVGLSQQSVCKWRQR